MVKVLFCGDTEGRLRDVLERVKKLNGSKLGPFDMLFCVGKFLDENNQIVIDESISFPIPTYVVLKDDIVSSSTMEQFGKLKNLTIIQNPSILSIQDMNVLCIPGIYDDKLYNTSSSSSPYYIKSDIDRVLQESINKPIDFVLSGEWASGMLHHVDRSKFPAIPNCTSVGSPIISEVLSKCAPRYHFAGSMNTFYERLPYRNSNGVITRMICLGPVKAAADKSRKWIHALNLQPRTQLSQQELNQCDAPCTPSPFIAMKRPEPAREVGLTDEMIKRLERDSQMPATNYRFAMPQTPAQPQASCWFCLAAPSVEKQLIVSIGQHSYLALPKGQLTAGHVLIIPIVHRQNTLQLEDSVLSEMTEFKTSLIKLFHSQGKAVLLWERNLTTRNPLHCQIQVIPLDANKEMVAKIVLDAAATQRGFRFTDIPAEQSLKEFAGPDDFLYAEVWPVGATEPKRFGYAVRERRPQMQFFHQAVGSLLESTNAGDDWKGLQKSVEEETENTNAFREMFKPYDFTVEKEKEAN